MGNCVPGGSPRDDGVETSRCGNTASVEMRLSGPTRSRSLPAASEVLTRIQGQSDREGITGEAADRYMQLATSREPQRVAGEVIWRVPSYTSTAPASIQVIGALLAPCAEVTTPL